MQAGVALAGTNRAAEHRFFAAMAWAILAVVVVGFGRSFFLRPLFPEFHPQTPQEGIFYLHGALFTAWVLLLALQPALVARRRVDLHRKIGWVGTGLAAVMIVVGVQGALIAARRGFMGIPVPGPQFMVIPLVDMVLFGLFVALAVLRRRDTQAHKRFMLIASMNLLAAAVARIFLLIPSVQGNPLWFFGGADAFFLPLIVWDVVTRRRLHWATLLGVVLTIASQPLRLMLSGTEAWGRFAGWLLG
jgi:FtsH-binding integral membrane protein